MSLTFRDALAADVPALVRLLADDHLGKSRETVSDPPDPAYLAAFEAVAANPNDRIVVGEEGGRVVACGQLTLLYGLSRRGALRSQIEGVRVASDTRGKGIGEALIAHLVALSEAAGCELVQLTSHKSRTRARAFYERLGFEATHVGMKLALRTG